MHGFRMIVTGNGGDEDPFEVGTNLANLYREAVFSESGLSHSGERAYQARSRPWFISRFVVIEAAPSIVSRHPCPAEQR